MPIQLRFPIIITLAACLVFGLTACSDDDDGSTPGSDATDGTGSDSLDGDTSSDADTPDPAEGPFMVLNRVQTPDSRTMFVSVIDAFDGSEIDLGNALELSGFSRARVYNEKVYTFDSENGQITRYRVAESGELELDTLADGETTARFSMAGEGVTGFSSNIAFINDQRAYFFDTLSEDQVVVWNPTTMEIVSTFDVPEFTRDGIATDSDSFSIIGDRVVLPLAWVNQFTGTGEPVVAIAVFSTTEDELIDVIEDSRCQITDDTFVDGEYVYVNGDSYSGLGELGDDDDTIPSPCMLRWKPGDDAFDPDFYVDLGAATDSPFATNMVSRGDGTIATMVYTSDTDPDTLGLFELLDGSHWQRAIVDYVTEASTVVDDIALSGVSGKGWVLDDEYHVPFYDEEEGESTFYFADENGAAARFTVDGEIFLVQKIQ